MKTVKIEKFKEKLGSWLQIEGTIGEEFVVSIIENPALPFQSAITIRDPMIITTLYEFLRKIQEAQNEFELKK